MVLTWSEQDRIDFDAVHDQIPAENVETAARKVIMG